MQEQMDMFAPAAPIVRATLKRSGDLPDDFVVVPDFLTKAEEQELVGAK